MPEVSAGHHRTTRHYTAQQKITKTAKTGVVGIINDDVMENFDIENLPHSNEVASDSDVRFGRGRFKQHKGTSFVQDLAGLGLAAVAPFEIIRRISQNFSPAGVTSPFEARAMPTDATSVVPVSGR